MTKIDPTQAGAKRPRGRPRKNPLPAAKVQPAPVAAATPEADVDPLFGLTIEKLRAHAYETYRIPVTAQMTKEDIIRAIRRGNSGDTDFAFHPETFGEGAIPPGWAKIHMFKNNDPTASNRPHYFNLNGYKCCVPFGVDVLVPIKLKNFIGNLKETHKVVDKVATANNGGRDVYKDVVIHRFPHSVLGETPGRDPRPGGADQRAARHAPREAFHKRFKFWPTKAQLEQSLMDGLISYDGSEVA